MKAIGENEDDENLVVLPFEMMWGVTSAVAFQKAVVLSKEGSEP